MLLHLMEASGIKQENLVGVIGSRGVVSEVVHGKRSISSDRAVWRFAQKNNMILLTANRNMKEKDSQRR